MKISYKWLSQYLDEKPTIDELSKILTSTGLEVEGVEAVELVRGGMKGLVIGQVVSCEKHPNAEKLSLTITTTDGENRLSIVCGAPNVAAGQKVIVATVGTTVHPNSGEPFEIKKAKIRGEISEGMLCAEDEIGMGESHDGILVLPEDATLGESAATYFNLDNDYQIEIGLTPNRTDAMSHLGVARDIAAYKRQKVNYPELQHVKIFQDDSVIRINIENGEACTRYMGVKISGITVQESSAWIKEKLRTIGLNPINNIADITNYVLHETGHPLHAFDADKIDGNEINVRFAKENEQLTTLDKAPRKLTTDHLVIAHAKAPMALAGVMGGLDDSITQKTTHIFIESACFNPSVIRKSARISGLKTDASFRYERGTSPEATSYALQRAIDLILQECTSAKVTSEILDIYPNPQEAETVHLGFANFERIIGKKIRIETIEEVLLALEFEIVENYGDGMIVKIPSYRTDVKREIDVIEEFLRIYGFDAVSDLKQIAYAPTKQGHDLNQKENIKDQLADLLANLGFNEIMGLTFIRPDMAQLGLAPNCEIVSLQNPLNEDLSAMRTSLLFSMLDTVVYNTNRRNSDIKVFELGRTYFQTGERTVETNKLTVSICGNQTPEHFEVKQQKADFFQLKKYLNMLISRLGLKELSFEKIDNPMLSPAYKVKSGKISLGIMGEIAPKLLKKYDLKQNIFTFELDLDILLKESIAVKTTFKELPKYPEVRRDLALVVDNTVTYTQINEIVKQLKSDLITGVNLFDVYKGDKMPEGKMSYALSFTLQDRNATLSDIQIDKVMQKIITTFEKSLGAVVRQ